MEGYDSASYGDRIAGVYDSWRGLYALLRGQRLSAAGAASRLGTGLNRDWGW